jgi:low temperature requirement protein LtrA
VTPLRTRMAARDITENHRVSSPLELLFDLTFVVAIAQVAGQLAIAIAHDEVLGTIGPFLMVFFAIWWAWNQFTWLASAYDTDDALYRVFTMVQMAGVLVLAAGVPLAMHGSFGYVTVGYLIMRVGLLAMLVRAMKEDPDSRPTTARYVIGISVVQALWLLRLLLPAALGMPAFVVLAIAELLVAPWASRARDLAWHPHHIAERYGLFTIILLGESVFASTTALQIGITENGITVELAVIAVAGLVLLFTLWWLYFAEPAGEGLVAHRERSYIWGYGHYLMFASLAAIGAGLEVTVESAGGHVAASPTLVCLAVAVPVSIFLVVLWAIHAPIVDRVVVHPAAIAVAVVGILIVPSSAPSIGVAAALSAMVAIVVGLLLFTLLRGHAKAEPAG